MTINEIRDRRNKLLHDAQGILLADEVSAEQRTSATKMIADADVLEQDIANLEKIEAENRSANPVPRGPVEIPEARNAKQVSADEQRAAFTAFMKFGVQGMTPEQRSILTEKRDGITSGSTSGGYLIPQSFYPKLIEAKKSWGSILNAVNTVETDDGSPLKIALDDDTGNSVSVIGEGSTVSEADPALDGVISSTSEMTTGVVKVSLATLQDSSFDVDGWLSQSFGKKWFRGLSNLVTTGATNVDALTGAHSGATSASATKIGYADVVALYAALDPAYGLNATWTMNSSTRAALMGVTDNYGRPLFILSPNAGAFDTLLGRPVILNQFLPDIAAGKVAIQFGDFNQGYLARYVKGGLTIMRLVERYADAGQVGFIGYGRFGGSLTNASSTDYPIVSLTQAAS